MQRHIKLGVSIIIPLFILMMPSNWIPIEQLSIVEHRVIAIFVLAALFWILEPIPIFATSILIIFLELIMISDKSFILFTAQAGQENFGIVLSYKAIMATLASPIIILFLGGFFLAMAAIKYRLDVNLARVLLKPFGSNPKLVLMGLMIITAILSMFMSNTATTAMMLAILAPILGAFENNDPGKIAFILAIPFSANIGGIGTPIGTPPNAVAMKYLTGANQVSFSEWMSFGVPYVIVMLSILWFLLIKFYPAKTNEIKLEIKSKFLKNWKAITVYVTFAVTILFWLLTDLHGLNSYIVAMIPVVVFLVTQIITAEDIKKLSWDVLWLIAGGIALGIGLEKTGLTEHLVSSIPFDQMYPLLIILLATLITILTANFMSNTATANLLLPIAAALGVNIEALAPLGGAKMIILGVALSASMAMCLPISTPPNAMAYASGLIKTSHMAKVGVFIGVLGLAFIYLTLFILKTVNFL